MVLLTSNGSVLNDPAVEIRVARLLAVAPHVLAEDVVAIMVHLSGAPKPLKMF
jgi:hypothetical protein